MLYWLGATQGRLVAYVSGGTGGRTVFLAILSKGARFIGDTGCNKLIKIMYSGFDLPEFDSSGVRNWKFHPGTIPTPPTYKPITVVNATTNTFTSPAHGYANNDLVAFQKRGADAIAKLPTPMIVHTQYVVKNVTTNTFTLEFVGGGVVDITDVGVGVGTPSKVFVYAANNIGLFDPIQGRPEMFPALNFPFPGLSYIEMRLPVELSTGTDEPTNLEIVMDGKLVYDHNIVGGLLAPTGPPISASNNALISLDFLKNDGLRPYSRFHAPSWIDWRDRCNGIIHWVGGNNTPATPSSFPTLSGVTYDPLTAKLTRISGGTGRAVTQPFPQGNFSTEFTYHGNLVGDMGAAFHTDAAGVSVPHWGVIILPNGQLLITNGITTQIAGQVNPSDKVKIAWEYGVFKAYINSIPLTITLTIPAQPSVDLYADIRLSTNVGQFVDGILIQPAGTNAQPRDIPRFRGGVVISDPTPVGDVFETEIALAPGTSWQDIDGEIVVLPTPARTPVFTFNADPGSSTPTNCSHINVLNNDPSSAPNYYRFSYRDADDPLLRTKYVFTDRPEHRQTYGLNQTPITPYGVLVQSQMERIGESLARLKTDLPFGFQIEGFLDSVQVAKGDFVNVVSAEAGYPEGAPALCMVLREAFEENSDVEGRNFDVRIITPTYYSDTDHGMVTPLGHTNISANFLPPPPVSSLVIVESGHQLRDGTFVSTIEGTAQFSLQPNQRGRIWWKQLPGDGNVVVPNNVTDKFTIPAGSLAAGLVGLPVSIVAPVGGALPAGLDPFAQYIFFFTGTAYELHDLGGSPVTFTDNGTGIIRLFAFSDWIALDQFVIPDPSTGLGVFEILSTPHGFYYVRVVAETQLGVSSGFSLQPYAALDLLGDASIPAPPSNITVLWDGVIATFNFDPSPSLNVGGYQVTDDLGNVIRPFINSLGFAETMQSSRVVRRVYAVSRSGIRSTGFASLTFSKPLPTNWINPVGGVVDPDGSFRKTATDGFGNCSIGINNDILTSETPAEILWNVNVVNKRKYFGVTEGAANGWNLADYRVGLKFLDDGTVTAIWALGVSSSLLGSYNVGEKWSLVFTPSGTRDSPTVSVVRRVLTGTAYVATTMFTFPAHALEYPARIVAGLYNVGSSYLPTFQIGGTLVPDIGVVPAITVLHNASYSFGDLAFVNLSDTLNGGVTQDFIEANHDGAFSFLTDGFSSQGYVMLDPNPIFTPPAPTGFHIWFKSDMTILVRNGATVLATLANQTALGDSWRFSREGGAIVIRRHGFGIQYVYTGGLATERLYLSASPLGGDFNQLAFFESTDSSNPAITNVQNVFMGKNRVDDIPQMSITNPQPGQVLQFKDTKLVINSFATLSAGSPVLSGGPNRILYEDGSSNLATNANFVFDGTNVGIGTASPTRRLHVKGTGTTSGVKNFQVDNSAGLQPFTIQGDGNVNIGATANPSNNSRVYILGGANGANVDVRGNAGSFVDQATIELEGNDYDTTVKSTYLLFRGSTYTGNYMTGVPNANLGVLLFGGNTSLIATDSTDLLFAPAFGEKGRWKAGGDFGIGTGSTVSAKLHVIKTTEQFRAGYDASNYCNIVVGSTGIATLDATGSAAQFVFNKRITVQSATVSTPDSTSIMIGPAPGGSYTGVRNTFIGNGSGANATSSDGNTCIGYQSGAAITTGFNNVIIGRGAGSSLNVGDSNIFIGLSCGASMLSDQYNVLIGYACAQNAAGVSSLVMIGKFAGLSITTGGANTFLGAGSGMVTTIGTDNTFVGVNAGAGNITSYNNTYVGSNAGAGATGLGNVFIGYQAGYFEAGNNKLYISNSTTSTPLIYGEFDNQVLYFTAQEIRQRYDASNYNKIVVGPSGAITYTAVGSGAKHTFANDVIFNTVARLQSYTVATLPAGNQGDVALATDLLAPGFLVVAAGGGAVKGPVFHNGVAWVAF